jgi:hypothetical protein
VRRTPPTVLTRSIVSGYIASTCGRLVASWSQPKRKRDYKRERTSKRQRGSTTEEGQTCPRCGDLYPWNALYCASCKMPLR